MVNAIKNLINKWSCHHEWVREETIEVDDGFFGSYHKFLFICKKCGKIKWTSSRRF